MQCMQPDVGVFLQRATCRRINSSVMMMRRRAKRRREEEEEEEGGRAGQGRRAVTVQVRYRTHVDAEVRCVLAEEMLRAVLVFRGLCDPVRLAAAQRRGTGGASGREGKAGHRGEGRQSAAEENMEAGAEENEGGGDAQDEQADARRRGSRRPRPRTARERQMAKQEQAYLEFVDTLHSVFAQWGSSIERVCYVIGPSAIAAKEAYVLNLRAFTRASGRDAEEACDKTLYQAYKRKLVRSLVGRQDVWPTHKLPPTRLHVLVELRLRAGPAATAAESAAATESRVPRTCVKAGFRIPADTGKSARRRRGAGLAFEVCVLPDEEQRAQEEEDGEDEDDASDDEDDDDSSAMMLEEEDDEEEEEEEAGNQTTVACDAAAAEANLCAEDTRWLLLQPSLRSFRARER